MSEQKDSKKKNDGALSEDDLKQVSGGTGKGWKKNPPIIVVV